VSGYLLDTNHLSPLVTIGHPLRDRILLLSGQGGAFAIPAPAVTEFLFGIILLPRGEQNLAEWARLAPSFSYLDVTRRDAEHAARLQVALRRQGWQLSTVDALIASIALRNDLTLLTTDGDFDQINSLKLENWLR
jgi:predicted nucleic acid-binding protein